MYGWMGALSTSLAVPSSITIPPWSTATRSAREATTPRSWLMKQHRHAQIADEPGHQVEDLGLDRRVEGGGRLVRQEQIRPARQGHGDDHALAHAAGELVWEGAEAAPRVRDSHHLHEGHHLLVDYSPAQPPVHAEGLADLLAHGHERV